MAGDMEEKRKVSVNIKFLGDILLSDKIPENLEPFLRRAAKDLEKNVLEGESKYEIKREKLIKLMSLNLIAMEYEKVEKLEKEKKELENKIIRISKLLSI